ncbi:alpha/beta hydrolase [Streptomyces mexicanus]|uniref:alpha/beta hydrolase n=1 Tax=Streptomyces mexicanus TaxID=178566 RepID=UPI003652C7A6
MHWVYDGAPRLNNFLDGLRAVQGGPEAGHTTVSGPSYGSTAVGAASKAPGRFAVDDVVVAGSPGTLVGDASDLDVGKNRVWAEVAGEGSLQLDLRGDQHARDQGHGAGPLRARTSTRSTERGTGRTRVCPVPPPG